VGEWCHAPGAPTVLLYAHHDVQPPGYVERWHADPFTPHERDGRLFGRGTADDKAGAVAHVAAVRAWLRTAGSLPCNVRVLVEGEEEIGSPGLAPFLRTHAAELQSDVLLLAGGELGGRHARLTYSLRGLCSLDVRVRHRQPAAQRHGWRGPRPGARAFAAMLASLVDEYGDAAFGRVLGRLRATGAEAVRFMRSRRRRRPAPGLGSARRRGPRRRPVRLAVRAPLGRPR
jgi:acetylornithine deacetylase/succinyl-diaminopimelate desuccinylase-like protein